MKTSNSAIQAFKQCRRMYELKYIHSLTPTATAEPLERGLQYHEIVEAILNGKQWSCTDPKVSAMGEAFEKYVYPKLSGTVKSAEDWFQYQTKSGHFVIGRFDGVTTDNVPIEHKTTGSLIDGSYLARLEMDEQIKTYLTATGSNKILYTVCVTPSISQKKNESDEEFYKRCFDWYAENTDQKIAYWEIFNTDERIEDFKAEQDAVISEMQNCKLYYRNPSHCMKWGRLCEYAPICMMSNDELSDQNLIGFERKEHKYEKVAEAQS